VVIRLFVTIACVGVVVAACSVIPRPVIVSPKNAHTADISDSTRNGGVHAITRLSETDVVVLNQIEDDELLLTRLDGSLKQVWKQKLKLNDDVLKAVCVFDGKQIMVLTEHAAANGTNHVVTRFQFTADGATGSAPRDSVQIAADKPLLFVVSGDHERGAVLVHDGNFYRHDGDRKRRMYAERIMSTESLSLSERREFFAPEDEFGVAVGVRSTDGHLFHAVLRDSNHDDGERMKIRILTVMDVTAGTSQDMVVDVSAAEERAELTQVYLGDDNKGRLVMSLVHHDDDDGSPRRIVQYLLDGNRVQQTMNLAITDNMIPRITQGKSEFDDYFVHNVIHTNRGTLVLFEQASGSLTQILGRSKTPTYIPMMYGMPGSPGTTIPAMPGLRHIGFTTPGGLDTSLARYSTEGFCLALFEPDGKMRWSTVGGRLLSDRNQKHNLTGFGKAQAFYFSEPTNDGMNIVWLDGRSGALTTSTLDLSTGILESQRQIAVVDTKCSFVDVTRMNGTTYTVLYNVSGSPVYPLRLTP